MKKQLLFLSFFISMASFAQVIFTENFESLTVGNVGTDLTGVTAGQGGWMTYNSAGGTNNNVTNYQIVDQSGDKKLQLTGSNAATGTKYMWQPGFSTAWTSRTVGNDIVEVEMDFYTGSATTSKNTVRCILFDNNTTTTVNIAGFYYVPETRILKGWAYYSNAGVPGNYIFYLGGTGSTDLVLTANTWYRLGFSWNSVTGEVRWKSATFNFSIIGAAAGLVPDEIDFIVTAGTANAVASTTMFDNYVSRTSATDTLLGITDDSQNAEFSIFPNPSHDFVTISSTNNTFHLVKVTDMNGRVVKSFDFSNTNQNTIDISNLTSGMYLVNVISDKGSFTQKIMKE
jgi:hypothetical protein